MKIEHSVRRVAVLIAVVLGCAWSAPAQMAVDRSAGKPARPAASAAVAPFERAGAELAGEATAGRDTDAIRFRNGDILHGALLGMDTAGDIRWRSAEAKGVIEFGAKNVVQLQFPGQRTAESPHQQALIRLTNDDQLRGDIVSLDAEKLVVETWYAGQLAIPRVMVRSIAPRAGSTSALYTGPTGLEGWRRPRDEGAWVYRRGAFYSSGAGAIGRDVKLPDRWRIEFDLAWRNYPYVQVGWYTDNVEALTGSGYLLQVGGNTVLLQRGQNGNYSVLGGNTTLENLPQRTRMRVGLLTDKTQRSIALLLDGVLVKQWVDPAEFAGTGTGLVFLSQGQGPLRVSNLSVSGWDGEMESGPPAGAPKEDLIRFVNNDKVSGQLQSISHNSLRLTTAYAPLDVPLERAVRIEFNQEKVEKARRQAADVQAAFQDGGIVTFALQQIDGDAVTGQSENFGRGRFSREAFRQLRLHIYDEKTELEDEEEWGK